MLNVVSTDENDDAIRQGTTGMTRGWRYQGDIGALFQPGCNMSFFYRNDAYISALSRNEDEGKRGSQSGWVSNTFYTLIASPSCRVLRAA